MKAPQRSLRRWTKQKWRYVGARAQRAHEGKGKPIARHKRGKYRPAAEVAAMSRARKAALSRGKNATTRKGRQHHRPKRRR